MEEIFATAAEWWFSGTPQWVSLLWYSFACTGIFWACYRFYLLIEEFDRYANCKTYWDYGNIDPLTGKPFRDNWGLSAPAPKSNSSYKSYTYKPKKPKHPPKPIFFGRINGKDVRIEGNPEEEYLTYWQLEDWRRWEREHNLGIIKEKAKNILSQASSEVKHEQKGLFKGK